MSALLTPFILGWNAARRYCSAEMIVLLLESLFLFFAKNVLIVVEMAQADRLLFLE